MIFPYQTLAPSRFEPIIPVQLQSPSGWILFNVFVDTGADYSVFHSDVAEILQLPLTKGKKLWVTVGDGDQMPVYLHGVSVRFAGFAFNAEVAFSKVLGSGFNLMGRKSFFEYFRFCFNDRQHVVSVTKLR